MAAIQAIALDLDGTLLNSQKEVSARNLEVLLKCHEKGIHIIIATARPPRAVIDFLPPELIAICSLIFYNGALIHCPKLSLNEHLPIPTELAREVYEFISLSDDQCYVYFEAEDISYCDRVFVSGQMKVFGIPENHPIPPIISDLDNTCITKILLPNHNIYVKLKDKFGELLNVICTDRNELIQIMNKHASKEVALGRVLELLQVSPEHTVAFGDDINDLGMLQLCGYSVSMGNAIDELKAFARIVAETNDADGVAIVLEKLLLE